MSDRRITRANKRNGVTMPEISLDSVEKKTKKPLKSVKKPKEVEKIVEDEVQSVSEVQNGEGGALKGREEEFESLKGWIDDSISKSEAVSVYISGQPGTGKTATTKRVIESFSRRKLGSCFINCASVSTKTALLLTIFESQGFDGKPTQENFERRVREMRTSLVLVLDEIDHLVSRKNSALYSAFSWPYNLSYKIIIIGIANSIDLTERLLPKLMLSQPPKRIVFEPYSKENIIEILTDKMQNDETEIDSKAVELCARKVAAMSGDLRTALHIFKQTKNRAFAAAEKEEAGPGTPKRNTCREVLGVMNSVYSSPLARAKLPLQPRILLAVCLALSSSKKTSFNRNSMIDAYVKTCKAIHAPQMDDDDLMAAFRTLESQSFVRQLNGGNLVLQIDSATARSAISDHSMLDQISLLNF